MIEILYQDDAVLAVHKPSGMLSVPGNNPVDGLSLIEHLTPNYPDARIVHRLDQATSGVMVIALGLESLRHIGRQFEQRETKKIYKARVYGRMDDDEGVIDLPLICDHPNRPLQKVCFENGKPSQTRWRVIARDDVSTIVELTPITGRSHQLRVHLMSIGYPIIGDKFYAPATAIDMSDRLELYACDLTITHPLTGNVMQFHAPSPYDRA